jgi:Pectate lyase superfamily protein
MLGRRAKLAMVLLATSTACAGAFPQSAHGTVSVSVLPFHADATGRSDSSVAFDQAIAAVAAQGGGDVYVPKGTYELGGVYLQSNVRISIVAGTVLRMAPTAILDMPMFYLAVKGVYGNPAAANASIRNVGVIGVGGSFTADMSHAPSPRNHFLTAINVSGFTVANVNVRMNDANQSGAASSSYVAAIALTADSAHVSPANGVISNIDVINAPFGFGAIQMTSGRSVRFDNIRSVGGVALRFETDGRYPGTVANVSATHIMCTNGHAAVMFAPHTQKNGSVTVSDIVARSCANGVRIEQGFLGGSFTNSSVSDGWVASGLTAQIRNPVTSASSGGWLIGRTQQCVSDTSGGTYRVAVSGVVCIGGS